MTLIHIIVQTLSSIPVQQLLPLSVCLSANCWLRIISCSSSHVPSILSAAATLVRVVDH